MRGWGAVACAGIAGCLAIGTLVATPTSAATVTVVMTGTWSQVNDTAGVLDGSITVGGGFTATLTFDDQTPDCEPFVGIGCFLLNGSSGGLTFSTGNYAFADQGTSQNGISVEDSVQGVDLVGMFFDAYVASGPLPSGVSLATLAYANPTLTDYSETALSSDRLIDVPWDASLFDTNFYFFGPITGRGPQDFIELDGVITSLNVVLAEPSAPALLALAGIAWVLRKRSC